VHNTVGKIPEAHQPEESDHASGEEHEADVSSENDAVKTDVFEVDILGKLLHKGVLHGQGPFLVLFLLGFSWSNIRYRTAREKSIIDIVRDKGIEVQQDGNRKAKPFSIISGDCPGQI